MIFVFCEHIRLAPVVDTIRYATIAGSHSNQVLRAWFYGLPHTSQQLTVNGRLSMDVLLKNDVAYYRAVTEGSNFEVIAACVVDEFPEFCQPAQSAANAATQVARPEMEIQICCKMLSFFKNKVGDEPVPYQDIAPHILRSKPPRPECIPYLYSFMVRCGGGKSAHLFTTTEKFVKAHGQSGRSLGVAVWDNLSIDVKQKGMEQSVLWRHSVLKTLYSHQEGLITGNDIKKSLTNKDLLVKVRSFEAMYKDLKKFGESLKDITPHQSLIGLGVFEVECVVFILGKRPKEDVAPFEQIQDSSESALKCVKFWRQFSEDKRPSPWDGAGQPASSAPDIRSKEKKTRTHM